MPTSQGKSLNRIRYNTLSIEYDLFVMPDSAIIKVLLDLSYLRWDTPIHHNYYKVHAITAILHDKNTVRNQELTNFNLLRKII